MTSRSLALPTETQEAPPDQAEITAWEQVSFTAVCFGLRAVAFVVGIRGLRFFAEVFGSVEWLINRRRRRRFLAAHRRILGREPSPAERRREARRYCVQTRYDKIVYLLLDTFPAERALSLIRFDSRAMFEGLLARQRGVYLALCHHGPGHILSVYFALCGYPTLAVRDRHESALRRFVRWRFDRRFPGRVRPRWFYSDAFPREIYRSFRTGQVVASSMDVSRVQWENPKVEQVTIFGETSTFVSGPLRMAIRSGSPVVQGFITPDGPCGYRFDIVEQLFEPDSGETEEQAVARIMPRYAANVERYLRESPALVSRI